MLEEAVEVIRRLWQGGFQSHYGAFYTVENARIYTLPEQPPPIMIAAGGTKAAELAGRIADGLIATSSKSELLEAFDRAGGAGKARYGEVTVCWARTEAEALRTAHECWPNAGLPGELSSELALPQFVEQAASLVREEDLAHEIALGPDPEKHLEKIRKFVNAGYDHIWIHQIGPDQDGFFDFYENEILPALQKLIPEHTSG
jgi:G6PDH family F420-dependent oxidoreductase